jgi:hypothetical protein
MEESQIWAGIELAGPLAGAGNFDPWLADDVLQAERAATQFDRRKAFVAAFAWAVPTKHAIERIAAFVAGRKLLEVCAGAGLWARLLSGRGVDVVATDGAPIAAAAHFPVETLEAREAVECYADQQALMLCWPPFKDECGFRALEAFKGDCLIYAGDTRFTGEARLHDLIETSWELEEQIALPTWPGISDSLYLYKRRT